MADESSPGVVKPRHRMFGQWASTWAYKGKSLANNIFFFTKRPLFTSKTGPEKGSHLAVDFHPQIEFLQNMLQKLRGVEGGKDGNDMFPKWESYIKYEYLIPIYQRLGPYTRPEPITQEEEMLEKGTAGYNTSGHIDIYEYHEQVELFGQQFNIPLAPYRELTFPSGYLRWANDWQPFVQKNLHFYGELTDKYVEEWLKIGEDIVKVASEKIIERWKEKYRNNHETWRLEYEKNLKAQISQRNAAFRKFINDVMGGLIQKNETAYHDLFMEPLSANIFQIIPKYTGFRDTLRPKKEEVILYHSHVIINYNHPNFEEFKAWWRRKGYDTQEIFAVINGEKIPGMAERYIGFDEFEMPHEVIKEAGKYYLTLDYYKHKYYDGPVPRTIPKDIYDKFTTDMDPLESAGYIHNHWDEFRDDMRDGRYHPESSQAIDYTLATSYSVKGKEWKPKNMRKTESVLGKELYPVPMEQRKFEMRLANGFLLKGRRGPSNLSPCLDLTRINDGRWYSNKHPGKLYYYATWEGMNTDLPGKLDRQHLNLHKKKNKLRVGGHVTTRGLSNWLINQAVMHSYSKKDMEAFFEKIGGLDWGPRTFGTSFIVNPYNPEKDYSGLNDRTVKAGNMGDFNKDEFDKEIKGEDFDHL